MLGVVKTTALAIRMHAESCRILGAIAKCSQRTRRQHVEIRLDSMFTAAIKQYCPSCGTDWAGGGYFEGGI